MSTFYEKVRDRSTVPQEDPYRDPANWSWSTSQSSPSEDDPYQPPSYDPVYGNEPVPAGAEPGTEAPGYQPPLPSSPTAPLPDMTQSPYDPTLQVGGGAKALNTTGTFRDYWNSLIQGEPANEETLRRFEQALLSQGSRLSPANASNQITKIWDPDTQQWVRVGFGEGGWTWVPQGDGTGPQQGPADLTNILNNSQLIKQILGNFGGATQDPEFRALISQGIADLIKQNSADVGDVSSRPDVQAYRAASQREAEGQRSLAAERLAAEGLGDVQGGSSGAATSDYLDIEQNAAEQRVQYEANMAYKILTDRQNRLYQALQLGAGYLTDQQRLELQTQLQSIQAALDLTRMTLQNQQFNDDLGFRIGAQEANLIAGGA